VVEDEASLRDGIVDLLTGDGHQLVAVGDGVAGVEAGLRDPFELVELDLMLPRLGGMEVCRRLRAARPGTPILMLTARGENIDQVLGLEMGADDYVVKPVEPRVLLARVEALLRRARPQPVEFVENRIQAGRLAVDGSRRAASIDGRDVELTTGDFDILWLLASRQGQVVTRDEILRVVRGIDYDGLDRSIDARICRLRKKLQEAGGAESMIKTVRLRGYLFAGE